MPKNLQMPTEIIEKWETLGFAPKTFRLLLFAPLIQTAWAEGFLQAGERRAIEKFAETEFDFAADALELAELKIWLDERPTSDLFEKMNLLLNEWLEDLPSDEQNRWRNRILQACLDVAHASPRIGFTPYKMSPVCPDEEREILEISRLLGFKTAAVPIS
jgi:hypothetical protein